jgi:hypothetical protein
VSRLRVYLPLSRAALEAARATGRFGPAPLRGHAVTDEVRSELAGTDEEELEYAAMTAAALDSLLLLGPADPQRRMVAAVDVPAVEPAGGEAVSEVQVTAEVPLKRLAAVLADAPDAAEAVSAARAALSAGEDADEAVDRCLDHELGWYAVQELDDLLAG